MKPGMNPIALAMAVAISAVTLAVGAGIAHLQDAKRISVLEHSMAVQQKLNVIQDAINTEQEQWDENAADRLNQETEANQL